jgi:hypothetical protein
VEKQQPERQGVHRAAHHVLDSRAAQHRHQGPALALDDRDPRWLGLISEGVELERSQRCRHHQFPAALATLPSGPTATLVELDPELAQQGAHVGQLAVVCEQNGR